VLEGEEFMRVGGTVKIKVDVRVVAATNKDLQTAIGQKLFREDLYYRLAVFPVTIPPLRERADDIPALVEHFVNYYCIELKKDVKTVAPASMELLVKHPWTGNVRELQNCIERAAILTDGQTILPEHLGLRVKEPAESGLPDLPMEGSLQEVSSMATQFAESRMIRKVLKETGGNKTKAAEILRVSYKTLLTKIKDYGLEN
jgi:DNA-binding NtrC family response regulator